MIGIIGGSGIYDPNLFKDSESIKINTPFGLTSSNPVIASISGKRIVFLARHSKQHILPPHKVNYKANLWALKELGVKCIISTNAVGSLKEEFKPGEIVIIDQFIDFTKTREYTYYNGPRVFHVSMAEPFCNELNKKLIETSKELTIPVKEKGTYVCIEGPRFSTKAESKFYRNFADVIGMTICPEATLARELEICYSAITSITDYDVWSEKPVDAKEVIENMRKNTAYVKEILRNVIPKIKEQQNCNCKNALKNAEIN